MVSIINGWDTFPDGPLGLTHGLFSAKNIDPAVVSDAVAVGFTRIRLNRSAILMEPSSGTFDWTVMDDAIYQCNKAGLRVSMPIREFGNKGQPNNSWATVASPCDPGGTYFYGSATNYANFAVAACRRYSADGHATNAIAPDGSKRALWVDCMEFGNEDFDVHGAGNSGTAGTGNGSPCRNPMRYVQYARLAVPMMRTSWASGGGGWTRRIGTWGCWWQEQAHIKDVYNTFCNPPTDATYNPSGDHTDMLTLFDYVNFHNYKVPAFGMTVSPYTIDTELSDIRAILNANGHTTMPIWITEFGADGPVNNVSAASQSTYYAANNDGTGNGALAAGRDNGAQHMDVYTMDGFGVSNGASTTYYGDAKSIAAEPRSGGSSVRFQAWTTIQNFLKKDNGAWAAKAIPQGFAGSTGSGGGGGGGGGGNPPPGGGSLTGAFAPLAATNINLTTEAATGDYGHWGAIGTTFDHKATGGSQISDVTVLGNASKIQNPSALDTFTYTDATPNATATATATGIKTKPPTTGGAGATVAPHVMVVALENTGYSGVVGNSNYANINSYLSTYSTCTKAYGFSHPSLPNYLTIASGWDQGVINDTYNPASAPLAGNTLVDQLIAAGINWKHYQEHMPSTGYLGGDSGTYPNQYTQHHNPWVYFKSIRTNSAQSNRLVNYSQLTTDLSGGTAPPFIFVTPGNEHNAHTGTDKAADDFVGALVSMVQASTWYTANSGIIVLWWDESGPGDTDNSGIGDTSSNSAHQHGGHICCVVISANNSGVTLASNINHAGVLRGIQKLYGLNPFLGKATNTINGDLTPLLGTTTGGGGGGGGGSATNNTGNGFTISAPADTNSRTLKIYTDANQGIATLVARLSDGSAPDFLDSTLTDNTGGNASAGVYTLTYQAASSGQTLSVFYTLSDNKVSGVLDSSDTFTRTVGSGLGTTTPGGQSYTLVSEAGSPAWAVASNQAKMTGGVGDTGVAVLGTHTLLDCESVGIVNLSNALDSGGLILRSNAGGTTYYRASLQGSAIVLAYVTGGVSTILNSQPASPKTNTNYWIRFRIVKSSLYAKFWPNDGTAEPQNWNVFASDTTLVVAGNFGFRAMIGAASDSVIFDTYSIVDLSAVGDPSYVSLYAADLPIGVVTATGSIAVVTSTPAGTIDLTATGEGDGDWIKPGYSSASSLDRKANVTQQISAISPIGSGTYTQNIAALLAWSWEDGTPDVTVVASTTESTVQGVSNGWSFTVPADTTPRTLNVYVAAKEAQGTFTATLSDGSFATYSDTSLNDVGTGTAKKYQITYNAGSASQTLTISWTMLTDNGGSGSNTPLILYGSNVASTTLTTADKMATTTGGTEAHNVTHAPASGANLYLEICSQGGTPGATSSLPAPTGNGWLYDSIALEGKTIPVGNWSALSTLSDANTGATSWTAPAVVIRFWKRNGSTYTAIGSITLVNQNVPLGGTKKLLSFPNTSLAQAVFGTGDKLYIDHFVQSGSGTANIWSGDPISCYVSNSATAGVANDFVITTPGFLITSGGTPGTLALDAASMPLVVVAGGGGGGNPPPAVNATITVNAADKVLPNTWTGLGVQQDAYLGANYKTTEIAAAPIRYYPLTEASGTVATNLGTQARNGTLHGGVTPGQPGLIANTTDTAMLFNGTSGYIDIPTTGLPTGASPWTMRAWVQMPNPLPASGTFNGIMNFGTTNTNEAAVLFFRGTAASFELDSWTATAIAATGISIVAGGIYQVAVTYDGTTATIYINGLPRGSAAFAFNIVTGAAQIGNDQAGDFWSGTIGQVVFDTVAWTAAQVATDYTVGTFLGLTSVQRAVISTRLNEINPPVIRTCADAVSWWCPSVAGTYTFSNAIMQEWYAVFDNAQANNIAVIVGVNSPAPFSTLSTSWCTAFADLIDYLINTLGYTCIKYVSGLSEPDTH